MDQPCSVKYQKQYVIDWSEKLPASVNFSFPCTSMATFRSQHDAIQPRIGNHCLPQAPPKSWVQKLRFGFFFLFGFFGMHRNPFLIRQCHNGHRGGYALLKWLIRTAIWFEHSPFQKAETSNLPALVNLTIETHSVSFHFTRTAIENKKSWTNTTCIRKRKKYPGEKHVKALLLPGTFGLPRWYQKHSKAHGYCGYSSPCYCLKGITFSNHWGWTPLIHPDFDSWLRGDFRSKSTSFTCKLFSFKTSQRHSTVRNAGKRFVKS